MYCTDLVSFERRLQCFGHRPNSNTAESEATCDMTVTYVKKYILIMYMYYYYFCSYTCINIYLATFNLWLWLNFDVYMMLRTSVSSNLSFSHTCFVFLIKYLASFFFNSPYFFFSPPFLTVCFSVWFLVLVKYNCCCF